MAKSLEQIGKIVQRRTTRTLYQASLSGSCQRLRIRQHGADFDSADLDKKVVLTGMGNKLELWNQEAWEQINLAGIEALSAEGFDFGEEIGALSI